MKSEVLTLPESSKFVHLPGDPNPNKDVLGGKGYGLAIMHQLGLPVPAFFTIDTKACRNFLANPELELSDNLRQEVHSAFTTLEQASGKKFGDPVNPLLVSVRSGAKFSMPGMMDTVLNLGLNDETVLGLASITNDKRFALDSYRRFIQLYGSIVLDIPKEIFSKKLEDLKSKLGINNDSEISADHLSVLVDDFKQIIESSTRKPFPQDPKVQLDETIKAVFHSWNGNRARVYREKNKIPHDLGTAVNIQEMVFGNTGENSGTGVLFTRNPATGVKELYGDYLTNAQGEDVVAGIRTPKKIIELQKSNPDIFSQLEDIAKSLELHFKDPQDIEFTVENNKLYILQTRSAKRTAQAAIQIAHSQVIENIINKTEAISKITPEQIDQIFHPMFDPKAIEEAKKTDRLLTVGTAASPGAASGYVVFDTDRAIAQSKLGKKIIMVRPETNPEDIEGIFASVGVLTGKGGKTSHAAVVTRGQGIPSVVGASDLEFNEEKGIVLINGKELKEGDVISFDGSTGEVFLGELDIIDPDFTQMSELNDLLSWADSIAKLDVWTNADSPEDAERARKLGAKGIGLCRTEHMFFGDRLATFQKLIISNPGSEERKMALEQLKEMQRGDFSGILKAMDGNPVVIRLLDPPLHEFLPKDDDPEVKDNEEMLRIIKKLKETNPMLGFRGVRLGIVYPDIYDMQISAIFEAASGLIEQGYDPKPKIMIPLVNHESELLTLKSRVIKISEDSYAKTGIKVDYQFGTMIETPRAAIISGQLAKHVDFFSFGSNDLTQMTFGYSRDDVSNSFMPIYLDQGILSVDPFQTLDVEGVGELIRLTVLRARESNPNFEIGICGEHGGDPETIHFLHEIGLDYASSSPFRVPVARLAAAQAVLASNQSEPADK